jgi:hypothetical protein
VDHHDGYYETRIKQNLEAHDRPALNSTNAPNTEKSLLWWCQTTIHIQIFSNLANEQRACWKKSLYPTGQI